MINRNYDIYAIEERVHNLEMGGAPTPGGGSWDYSTEETDTQQKWIDGKNIYSKVIEGTITFPSNLGTVNITNISDLNLSTIVDVRAISTQEGTSVASCANPMCFVDGNVLKGINFGQFNAGAVILFYTKNEATKKRSKK